MDRRRLEPGSAILVENVTAVSRSVIAKFPALTYALVHKINAGDVLNYIL